MTRHCHQCGWEWTFARHPGRTETCERCGAEMRVCLNCRHFDLAVAQQCREPRAEPVADKDRANFCDWFDLARRVYTPRGDRRSSRRRLKYKFF